MKYRINAVVGADILPPIIEAIFTGIKYDPQLMIVAVEDEAPEPVRKVVAKRLPPPKTKQIHAPVGKRAELVEAVLKKGPKRWGEMREALAAGGLSETSLNSLLGKWKKTNRIRRSADGLWSLVEDAKAANA